MDIGRWIGAGVTIAMLLTGPALAAYMAHENRKTRKKEEI